MESKYKLPIVPFYVLVQNLFYAKIQPIWSITQGKEKRKLLLCFSPTRKRSNGEDIFTPTPTAETFEKFPKIFFFI